ncbi:MAG: LssY C-terminal domain-containing protein [Deltaproteobacteria bacterium]|nr:LssY C-terminal domain-containing protein [Deltaproteobacteria bacterium]
MCLLVGLVEAGCATRSFDPVPLERTALLERVRVQSDGFVRVRAGVPGPDETRAIFSAALYDRGIQPVWIEVSNRGQVPLRFAPAGMDRQYFSPFEVAYIHRGGFSKADRERMERFLHASAMPRQVPSGQMRAGFVFTHVREGTKGFNVDLYAVDGTAYGFSFFIDVPGFEPDHAAVDFDALYAANQLKNVSAEDLRAQLLELGCCTSGQRTGEDGLPINAVLIAPGIDLLHALLRAGWQETVRKPPAWRVTAQANWDGRPPDAVFRMPRSKAGDRSELRLWLTPLQVEGTAVWIAQITHYVKDFLQLSSLDPDVDDARNYLLQSFWYGQGLRQYAWVAGGSAAPIDQPKRSVWGPAYFTDGYRLVLWLSGPPVGMADTRYVEWDFPPAR